MTAAEPLSTERPAGGRAEPAQIVPAVMRAAAILDLLAARDRPARLIDIARALSLPKSSAHALCQTLVHLRLLQEGGDGFAIGPGMLHWASAFNLQSELVRAFDACVASDPDLAQHTLTLSVLEGTEVVYIAVSNANAPLGITFRIGMRMPAVYAATGKAQLATLSQPHLAALLAAPWPKPFTAASIAGPDALRQQLQGVRAQGYSLDDGEIRQGMLCLGAAIVDGAGTARAALAMSMTSAEAPPARRAELGARVAAVAAQLSARIGRS